MVDELQRIQRRGSGPDSWLTGGGEMGNLVRTMDWSRTPLGPLAAWPQSLRTTVGLVLNSSFPTALAWGPAFVQIYNDAYAPLCGANHPHALGMDFRECWAAAWHVIGDAFASARAGVAAHRDNQRLFLDRFGFLEEASFTFSFSPVHDEHGVAGLYHPVSETTEQMLGERRTRSLRDLAARTRAKQSVDDTLVDATRILAEATTDIPFVLCYALDDAAQSARLVAHTGLAPGTAASPTTLDPAHTRTWPIGQAVQTRQLVVVDDLLTRFGPLRCGPYPESPHTAVVLPIVPPGHDRAVAVMIAGVSPRLVLDDAYRTHYALLVGIVATSVAGARAYAEERRRADTLTDIDLAKTAFFSNISHEFRTPLGLILGPLEDELAEPDSPLPAERLARIGTAHRSARRLLKLVNTLLDVSRLEAGRMQASYVATDLAALTTDLASMFRSAADRAGLEYVVDCPPLPGSVHVDREMWEKIVLNLLSNAVKHTFEGSLRVALAWHGDHVELTVHDTGVGIPADVLPHLFDRFYRVPGARSRTHEGTGIGLALVRELVTLHGGTLGVASEEGAGTTFTVSLPTGKDHLPVASTDPARAVSGLSAQAAGYLEEALHWLPGALPVAPANDADGVADPRPRILWCDDNADMRAYVADLLSEHYAVTAVADGFAGLLAARESLPDLVLADVMMPELDGFALLRALRSDSRTATLPVILLSARAGEEAAIEGLAAGADDYLFKPFSAKELLARVRTHLEMSRLRRAWELQHEHTNRLLDHALQAAQVAREEALDAARAKADFLAAMSHEIRTPMNAVIGFASLLADTELSTRQREFATAIRASGDHLLNIINDILDLSKLQSGRFELSPAPFDLRRTVEAALDFVAASAADKGLELAYVVEPGTPTGLQADEPRVRQILTNYLSNAVKFTTSGEIVVHVDARPLDDGRHEFHVRVRDTGVGIAPQHMNRLFREFSQADNTIARSYGGTGLGLAISRQLAELHGGRAWAESTAGVGSTFHFTILAASRTDAELRPQRPAGVVRGLKILLVHDNPTNLEILRNLTESWGMFVRATRDPSQALKWLELGDTFDLIMIDQKLQGSDGVGFARRVRSARPTMKTPMVLLSSLASNARAVQASSEFAAVLTKPIRQSVLFDRLAEILGGPVPILVRPPTTPVARARLSILLVEDNVFNQRVALLFLDQMGYAVDLAASGEAALNILGGKPYDVILMDIEMPGMNGLETTREIRRRAGLRQPYIIAMTANALQGDRDACLAAGMNDYISKPIVRQQLAEALRTAAAR